MLSVSGGAQTNAPASRISRIAPSAYAAGFVLQRIGTDETFDFSAPEGAFVATNWVRHGAATARVHADLPDWTFPFGDGYVTNLAAFANGVVMPDVADTNRCFSPFSAPLGIVPMANWSQLPANGNQTIEQSEQSNNSPSVFWWTMTDRNSIVCTWQNVLLDRMPTNPVSFQVEFRPGGSFVYRYDLSRLASDDLLTNVTVGVKNGDGAWFAPAIGRSLTSLKFARVTAADIDNPDRDGDGIPTEVEMFDLGTDPDNADTDFDGLPDGKEIEAGLDPCSRDSDGDGLVDASDPDPANANAFVDDDRDGINDDYERHWFGDTNVVDNATRRKPNGFALETEILAGLNPTNAAPSPVTYVTNSLVSWMLFDAFAVDTSTTHPSSLTPHPSVVWQRTFNISKTTPWQQYFVSAAPDSAAGWMLEDMRLEWQDSNGNSGSVARSPAGDSWRIPLSTNATASVTLRLVATSASVRSTTPLYLIAFCPEIEIGGSSFTGLDGVEYTVFTDGSDSQIGLTIDWDRRPCLAPRAADESDAGGLAEAFARSGSFSFEGTSDGGTIHVSRPGVCALPDVRVRMSAPVLLGAGRLGASGGGGKTLVVLSPNACYDCQRRECGSAEIWYEWTTGWYLRQSTFPYDTPCLSGPRWLLWDGGWECGNEVCVSSGVDGASCVGTRTNGDRGIVLVGGVEVWSGKAKHNHLPNACLLYEEGSGGCCEGCENGNCDSQKGPLLGSLRFRIPLGSPQKDQLAGFLWFATEEPVSVSASLFSVDAHPSAHVTDVTAGGVRRVSCTDPRGRTLAIEDISDGVRITVTVTATGALEHTWEITNVGGPESVRLRKISRLANVMSDETYDYDDGDWTRTDNIAGVTETLWTEDDLNGPEGVRREWRTLYDASGNWLRSSCVEETRVGECENAVLRETYREESSGWNTRWTRSDYWNDPQHVGRHGLPRLVWGNEGPWRYSDYDEFGRRTLLVEQMNGSPVPDSFPALSPDGTPQLLPPATNYQPPTTNLLPLTSYLLPSTTSYLLTSFGYDPPAGDSEAEEDERSPRTETKYVVRNGTLTLVGRKWMRLTRLTKSGFAAVKTETWRASDVESAAIVPPSFLSHAYSYEIVFDEAGVGTPPALRGEVAESLDENGLLTQNAYTVSNNVVICTSRKFFLQSNNRTIEQSEQSNNPNNSPHPTYTVTETDADYGNVLRQATYLTDGDVLLTEERSTYDDRNRLRSTVYSDGTSLTNSYSCCRLLWKRDREGRKTLRSAQTGTDHLYNADEEVWLTDISTYGGYRVTQHYFDALGRETNTLTYVGFTPGEANDCQASNGKVLSSVTTEYPNGGSDLAIRTDERGCVTMTRTDLLPNAIENGEEVQTNGVRVSASKTRTVFGGGSTVRREWGERDWTEESRFTDYAADGRRIDYAVTTSPDCGTVTNSIAVYDWLGRLASSETPLGVTTYAYDGATSRALSTHYEAGSVSRTATYLYNAQGEQCGIIQDGVTQRRDISYEVVSGLVWRVTREATVGSDTNALIVTRERLTGLGNGLLSHVETSATGGPSTVVERTRDAATGVVTESTTSSVTSPVTTESFCGLETKRTADGEDRTSAYDALGRCAGRTRCPQRAATQIPFESYVYNPLGDLVEKHTFTNETDAAIERYAYDMLGRRVSTVNALGDETTTDYDVNGNVVAEAGATYPVRYAYDTQGRRVAMWTNRGGDEWDMTRWAYDPATGLCTSKTYSDGTVVTYEYTADGLLETTRYASGHWTRNIYDEKRQLAGVQYDDASDVSYVRDAYGRETSASNGTAAYAYTLASNGIATNETATVGGISCTLLRSLDDQGRITSLGVDTNGLTGFVNYAYRPDGRLGSVTNDEVTVIYGYSNDGLDTGYTLSVADGATFTRTVTRDPFRRDLVTAAVNSEGADYAYSYDALSRPMARNGDFFAYNFRSEVIGASIAGNNESYDYDNIGNSIFAAFNSVTNYYTANNLNQYTTVGRDAPIAPPVLPTYDDDGNLLAFGPLSYTYDSARRLVSVSSNGVLLATNSYDHQGRRVRLVTQTAAHTFIYDGWNVVLELVEHDGVTDRIEYYWGKDISGSLQGAGGIGGLLYLKRNGLIFVPIYDAYGNVMEYRAADGSLAASYVYDSFGRTISQNGPLAEVFRFRYSTKSFERETDLYYYVKRFYSLDLRRWLNRDPIEEVGGVNLYAFCQNNGVVYYDKNGNAYFAIRGLGKVLPPLKWSSLFVCPFMKIAVDVAANALNVELVHEQLFYADGSNVGWGNDDDGLGLGRKLVGESSVRYVKRDGGYNDCVMHKAEGEVKVDHYQLTWFGARTKCNCQDYADMLRAKYRELISDPAVRCECGIVK